MRKSLFLALAAVTLLAGCSKDEGITNADNGNGGNGNEDAPVLVQLGTNLISSNTTQTRGSLDEWNNNAVGVLGLAENATADWDVASYNATCIMPNVSGTVTGAASTAINVVFANTHYYPLDNSVNYSFYGYHPYTDNANITSAANVVTATYPTFDGTQDILWGKIKATPLTDVTSSDGKVYEGFNARYFRKMKTPATPNINFDHKLVRLKFNISGGQGDITDLQVESIKLKNVPTSLSLIAADKASIANEGTIIFAQNPTGVYTLKNTNGTDATAVDLYDGAAAVVKAPMGESIMLPATSVNVDGNYTTEIKLKFKTAGKEEILPSEFSITPPAGNTFIAGNSYNINITIHGLTSIDITATLTPWGNGGDSDIEIN